MINSYYKRLKDPKIQEEEAVKLFKFKQRNRSQVHFSLGQMNKKLGKKTFEEYRDSKS